MRDRVASDPLISRYLSVLEQEQLIPEAFRRSGFDALRRHAATWARWSGPSPRTSSCSIPRASPSTPRSPAERVRVPQRGADEAAGRAGQPHLDQHRAHERHHRRDLGGAVVPARRVPAPRRGAGPASSRAPAPRSGACSRRRSARSPPSCRRCRTSAAFTRRSATSAVGEGDLRAAFFLAFAEGAAEYVPLAQRRGRAGERAAAGLDPLRGALPAGVPHPGARASWSARRSWSSCASWTSRRCTATAPSWGCRCSPPRRWSAARSRAPAERSRPRAPSEARQAALSGDGRPKGATVPALAPGDAAAGDVAADVVQSAQRDGRVRLAGQPLPPRRPEAHGAPDRRVSTRLAILLVTWAGPSVADRCSGCRCRRCGWPAASCCCWRPCRWSRSTSAATPARKPSWRQRRRGAADWDQVARSRSPSRSRSAAATSPR